MPRPRSVDDIALLERLTEVFRDAGFAGASLGDLATASGLRRASLYHRFPDGKEGMANAVLDHVGAQFGPVLEPMRTDPDVAAGVAETARRIGAFYGDGGLWCALDTLTLHGAPDPVRDRAAGLARAWIDAMADAARRGGADDPQGRATEAFVRIEGALVLARVLEDPAPFQRVLDGLATALLEN